MGSQGGGKAAAIAYTLIETAKLNGVDPQAWLTHVLGRIQNQKITQSEELLPPALRNISCVTDDHLHKEHRALTGLTRYFRWRRGSWRPCSTRTISTLLAVTR